MLARVAEALYLTARELERAEATSRLLEVAHTAGLERGFSQNGTGVAVVWEPLVEIVADPERFRAVHGRPDESSVAWFLTFSPDNPDGIVAGVGRARERARSVQDRLPPEVWEGLNGLYLEVQNWSAGRMHREGVYSFCQAMRRNSYLIQGLIDHGMRRDDGWTFMRLGRFLERARFSARQLGVQLDRLMIADPDVAAPLALQQWQALLASASADAAYAMTHSISPTPESIARFLVLDERFPRSVAFCLAEIAWCLGDLERDEAMVRNAPPVLLTRQARELLGDFADQPWGRDLRGRLTEVQHACGEIGAALATTCFAAGYERSPGDRGVQAQGQSQN